MNKGELIAALAAKTEMTKKDSEAALNRPARVARNPRTGASVKIAACKAPAFKAGKALKDAVNK